MLRRHFDVSRRPHPLARLDLDLIDAIREETSTMQPLREQANFLLDTSSTNVHDRKNDSSKILFMMKAVQTFFVTLMSLVSSHGAPGWRLIMWDVRFLPNPYFDESLRSLTGRDPAIQDFVYGQEATQRFYNPFLEMVKRVRCPPTKKEGKRNSNDRFGLYRRQTSLSILNRTLG